MNPSSREAPPEVNVDRARRGVKLGVIRGVPPRLHPIGRYRARGDDLLGARRAVCHRRGHRAPEFGCTCGFHAVDDVDHLPAVTEVLADSVVLEVELGGTIVVHERGVRAAEQAVLSVGFPRACSWCGRDAVAVVPGRLWRSSCASCAEHPRRQGISRASATAALGVDVSFVDVPVEPVRRRRWGTARAASMVALSAMLSFLTWRATSNSSAVAMANAGTGVSTIALVATARSRSARPHSAWFVGQCACLALASIAVRLLG